MGLYKYMNDKLFVGLMVICLYVLGLVVGYNLGENQSCPVAEVYMIGNVQEDDLFIPASSIGRVDLKR